MQVVVAVANVKLATVCVLLEGQTAAVAHRSALNHLDLASSVIVTVIVADLLLSAFGTAVGSVEVLVTVHQIATVTPNVPETIATLIQI